MSQEWLIAMGLFLVFEGLMPALFPKVWKRTMSEAIKNSDNQLRIIGIISMLIGLAWIYWVI
ncbi:DUF2065 domain-containing protein [Kangiella sp. HZ709]|uniref:DUF2065 domain-containing protein n=1 Tax=Kangiella sp. HZ709 TaxID=2666328 RepID=UPI0012B0992B|nr:DUF2065 domain-containing protein [Kangiella sp. HZ709]MRX27565.1 DUF2065 family protein [Kangiella sp. HZ709]